MGQAPQPERGARQRAGLTLASPSNTFPCQRRRVSEKRSGRSKNRIDTDHGIYRKLYPAGGMPRVGRLCVPKTSSVDELTESANLAK
jgi:hypothetical protein